MANTTNYNLEKPLPTESADIDALNRNSDKIDAVLKQNADNINTVATNARFFAIRGVDYRG